MKTTVDELTAAFYAWEKRGRGWHQWPYAVALEPPFRPFYGHGASMGHAVDDGRQETLLSRMLSMFSAAPPKPVAEEAEIHEPTAMADASKRALIEMVIALPEGTRVDRDTVDALLMSFAACTAPLAFEVVATASGITLQFTAREEDAVFVEGSVRAYFPTTAVAKSPNHLATLWTEAGKQLAIFECGLAREFMLPLRTFSRTDPDPLTALFATLGQLENDELGILQVIFQAARNDWRSSALSAVTDSGGEPFFIDAPQLTDLAEEKTSDPLFAAVIRVAALANTHDRAMLIADRVAASLASFSRTDGNEFVVMGNEVDADLEWDLIARTTHRSGMLLSPAELAGIVHPPSASIVLPKLTRRVRRSKAAPASAGATLTLGVNEHSGLATAVGITADQRMRHMHVIGASGTGKSSFLLDLIQQTIERGEGIAVLDPHGDLVDDVLARIPDGRSDDVVFLDASDTEYAVGLNLLAAHSDQERTLLASDLVAVFRRLATTWGDQMNTVLANAIQAFLASNEGGSLADLRRFLIEIDFRQAFLKTVDDEEIVYYWTREYPLLVGKPAAPILTRLDSFLRPKPLRAMLATRENKVDFRELMDKGRIFLAKLAEGVIGQENAALLGSVLVAKFHQAAIGRQGVRADDRRDFHLVIDEFQELVTPSLAGILSGTRKYRLGLTAAHQDLRQLYAADPAVAAALLANAATRVVFRVSDDDAKKLADGFSSFDPQSLTALGVGEAICRMDRADHDFNVRTRRVEGVAFDVAERRRQELRRISNAKYATPTPTARTTTAPPSVPEADRLPVRKRKTPSSGQVDPLQKMIRKAVDADETEH